MNGDIYTSIAEKLREIGGIDEVGVVSGAGQSAIIYAGNKDIVKYYYGAGAKQSVIFSVSAMDISDNQKALAEKLCGICERLAASSPEAEGITQARVKINSLPTPTMHNEHYWVYTASVEIIFHCR